MKLSDSVVRKFATAKAFKDFQGEINSIDFSADGQWLIASSDDDSIVIYNSTEGTRKRQTFSKKYGVDLIKFAHDPSKAVHASNKINDTIRFLSLPDNKYICYYNGHEKKVTQIAIGSGAHEGNFISASLDQTVRLWDLRSQNCQGLLNTDAKPFVDIDPECLIFAVTSNCDSVKLYDFRTFDKGPFFTFRVAKLDRDTEWTGVRFSPNGRQLAITTNKSCVYVLDAFTGRLLHTLTGHLPEKAAAIRACYSPDSAYVMSGSADRKVFVWCAQSGRLVTTLSSVHGGAIRHLMFNPKFMVLCTACAADHLCMWLPADLEDE